MLPALLQSSQVRPRRLRSWRTTIGTLTLERRQRPGPWLREQIDLARAIAYQAASAIGAARPRR